MTKGFAVFIALLLFSFAAKESFAKDLTCRLTNNQGTNRIVLYHLDEARSQITWKDQGTFSADFTPDVISWLTPYPEEHEVLVGYFHQLDRITGDLIVERVQRDGSRRPLFSGSCSLTSAKKAKF